MNAIQTYQFNNREVQVDLGEAPRLSDSSKKVLQQELSLYVPPQLEGAELKSRIDTLPSMVREIQEAKDGKVQDRLLACLKVILVAASVAATVLCIMNGSLFAILGIVAFMAASLWGIMDAAQRLNLHQDEGLAFSAMIGAGIFLPLFEVFSRIIRLEASLDETKETIEQDLEKARAANLQLLPENYRYYQRETARVEEVLTRRIEESEKSLQGMEILPTRSPAGEAELSSRLAALRETRENWTKVVEFYNQFNA